LLGSTWPPVFELYKLQIKVMSPEDFKIPPKMGLKSPSMFFEFCFVINGDDYYGSSK